MPLVGQAVGFLKNVFDYNRGNFMQDRHQRQLMEYDLASFRIDQAKLWREDIRDIAELTPQKLESYMLVIALELGFCVMALAKGRVPPGTPHWLCAGHIISITGAFIYLVLALWFGMHAFVSAQAYKVRILTQIVRLPIPTWRSLEASRTYSSAFERMGRWQMLRVPFFGNGGQGCQADAAEGSLPRRQSSRAGPVAADPWGLERRGGSFHELQPDVSTRVEAQRHIWLIREASKFYQAYDAFSRVAMSAGTCSLATSLCYLCLSHVLTEHAAPAQAAGGMVGFGSAAFVIICNDMVLSRRSFTIFVMLRACPLVLGFVVAFETGRNAGYPGRWEYLMPAALVVHSCSELYYLVIFRVREVRTGALLPLAFRRLLFLDPFAWARHTSWRNTLRQNLWQQGGRLFGVRSRDTGESPISMYRRSMLGSTPASQTRSAATPMSPQHTAGALMSPSHASRSRMSLASEDDSGALEAANLPSMECIARSEPARPEDVGVDDESAKPMFQHIPLRPGTFSPGEARERASSATDMHGEYPGLVPWRIFCFSTMVLAAMWWLAAGAAGAALWNASAGGDLGEGAKARYGLEPGEVRAEVGPKRVALGSLGVRLSTAWEQPRMTSPPRGFTCDPSGHVFAALGPAPDGKHGVLVGYPDGETIRFQPSPACRVAGGVVQDVTLATCSRRGQGGSCFADVLFGDGTLLSCALTANSSGAGSAPEARPLKLGWLQDSGGVAPGKYKDARGGHFDYREEISAITASPCPEATAHMADGHNTRGGGCFAVGTTSSRIVQLGQLHVAGPLLPRRLLKPHSEEIPVPGSMALLKGRYLGMLLPTPNSVQLFDLEDGGALAGIWHLPKTQSGDRLWGGICGGDKYLYLMEEGAAPSIWRFPVPKTSSWH